MGPSTAPSQQPWMNPALLLNPTGKHFDAGSIQRNSFPSGLGPNGFQSGPEAQPNLMFQFSNTNGDGSENDPNNVYTSSTQYSNSTPFSPSDPSASPYSIPHHKANMTNGLPSSHPKGISDLPPNGMGSMIERMNNVQDRSTVPVAKRQKMMSDDDSERGPKNGFSSSSSGILSGYVKDKQRAGLSMLNTPASGKAQATLDLTGGIYPLPPSSFEPNSATGYNADIHQMMMTT